MTLLSDEYLGSETISESNKELVSATAHYKASCQGQWQHDPRCCNASDQPTVVIAAAVPIEKLITDGMLVTWFN